MPAASPQEILHFSIFSFLPVLILHTFLQAILVSSIRLDLLAVHLLGTPALVGLAHVRWGLDGRNKFEHQVCHTDKANDGTGDVPQHTVVQHNRTSENIDWEKHE